MSGSALRRRATPARVEALLLVAGCLARFNLAARRHNFDFDSYLVVDGILRHGGNVYASTDRYNYGPAWMLVLRGLGIVSQHDPTALRLLLALFLTGVDLAVYALVRRRFGRTAGLLFFLNPVQIIICGYHNQFDTLAILVGLLAVLQLERPGASQRRFLLGVGLLGLSLVVKHVLFLFPLWLALRERSWVRRLVLLTGPVTVFLVSFLPWLSHGGLQGVVHHVFKYRSVTNTPLLHVLGLARFSHPLGTAAFIAGLALAGVLLRRLGVMDLFLAYLLLLVVLSPGMVNQYLAIVSVPIAVWCCRPFVLYAITGGVFLAAQSEGLGLAWLDGLPSRLGGGPIDPRGYDLLVVLLAVGATYALQAVRRASTSGAPGWAAH